VLLGELEGGRVGKLPVVGAVPCAAPDFELPDFSSCDVQSHGDPGPLTATLALSVRDWLVDVGKMCDGGILRRFNEDGSATAAADSYDSGRIDLLSNLRRRELRTHEDVEQRAFLRREGARRNDDLMRRLFREAALDVDVSLALPGCPEGLRSHPLNLIRFAPAKGGHDSESQ
jgi:hypothetical protein